MTYQWYIRKGTTGNFSKSSVTSANYSTIGSTASNGRELYCVVTDKYGKSVSSDIVSITVADSPIIIKQPQSVTVQSGQTARINVQAIGEELTYQWYIRKGSNSEFSKSSVTSANYSTLGSSTSNGRELYCVITDKYGSSVTTETVSISVISSLSITEQPQNVIVHTGETARITVQAFGEELTYQWYIRKGAAGAFSKSSVTSAKYSTIGSSASNDRQLYCVITDKYGNSVTTDTVSITVITSISITSQPQSVTVQSGQTARISVQASGEGLTYQWYIRKGATGAFSKSSVTSANYSTVGSSSSNGRQLYCVITDKYGNTVTTNTVTIEVK